MKPTKRYLLTLPDTGSKPVDAADARDTAARQERIARRLDREDGSQSVGALQVFVLETEAKLAAANAQHYAVWADFMASSDEGALMALRITAANVAEAVTDLLAARAALRSLVDERVRLGAA